MLNVVLQVFTEKQSILIRIGSCVMYRDTYQIGLVVYLPTPKYKSVRVNPLYYKKLHVNWIVFYAVLIIFQPYYGNYCLLILVLYKSYDK